MLTRINLSYVKREKLSTYNAELKFEVLRLSLHCKQTKLGLSSPNAASHIDHLRTPRRSVAPLARACFLGGLIVF